MWFNHLQRKVPKTQNTNSSQIMNRILLGGKYCVLSLLSHKFCMHHNQNNKCYHLRQKISILPPIDNMKHFTKCGLYFPTEKKYILLFVEICGRKMEVAISAKTLYRILYWTLYLGLCFISGWFVLNSGVLDHYISRTTSFAQLEEKSTKRPVISINLETKELPPVLNTNIWIYYTQSYRLWPNPNLTHLIEGENDFLIREINETEKVFFHQNKFYYSFRIIPLTDLLEERAKAFLQIKTKKPFNPKIPLAFKLL